MKRPVLVTVSGMVGSGKTTAVRHILNVLRREGIEAADWRFQRLPCITLSTTPPPAKPVRKEPSVRRPPGPLRGEGYRARALTSATTFGYLVRSLAFRIYRRWPPTAAWAVSNRYFYDSFAHFDLSQGYGELYVRLFRRIVPKPDLAFLMVASPETVAERRPQYSVDYIVRVEASYRRLRALFPELIEINSDLDGRSLEQVEHAVREHLGRRTATESTVKLLK